MQAPEVYVGLPYNEKIDIFSLGVVMFEVSRRIWIKGYWWVVG